MTSREPTGQAISDETAKAATRAVALHEPIAGGWRCSCQPADEMFGRGPLDESSWDEHLARAVIAAALPHIRSAIADEIEAAKVPLHDPNIEIQRLNAVIRAAYDGAARVARGGPTE